MVVLVGGTGAGSNAIYSERLKISNFYIDLELALGINKNSQESVTRVCIPRTHAVMAHLHVIA